MSVVKEGFVQEVIGRYDGDPGMLIPMMQDLQAEYGYLPPEELRRLARELGTPLPRVYGIAMFYSSFRLSPKGLHEVTLCMGTVCYLKGAPKISEAICEEYGIQPGGTTADRLFTLQAVNCVGACALAPVMVVDGKYYDGVTPDSALKVLKGFGEAAAEPTATAVEAEPSVKEALKPVAPSIVPPAPAAKVTPVPKEEPAARAAAPAPIEPAAPPKVEKPDATQKKPDAAQNKPAAKKKPAEKDKGRQARTPSGKSGAKQKSKSAKKRSRP